MTTRFGSHIICLLLLTCYGASQMAKIVAVTNQPSSIITIAPIDPTHPEAIPADLISHVERLPPGSFLLHNHSTTAITAVVTQWKITSTTGVVETQNLKCTGYNSFPRQVMVRSNDFTLITAHSCAKSELFPQLDRIAMNSPFQFPNSGRLVDSPQSVEKIEITVDSVIFEDGSIWGPDTQKYYRRIWADYLASQEVVNECKAAATRGEDIKSHANKIRGDLETKTDRASALKKRYAGILAHSPNPQRTLVQLQSREALPEFHHIEEGKQ